MALRLFGHSKSDIWKQLSAEIGAEYDPGRPFGSREAVRASHGAWTVTLDTFVVMAKNTPIFFTRMRAPFVNPSGFRFKIQRRNVFWDVAEWLGVHDIAIGDDTFDHEFIIKGSEREIVQALFADASLRAAFAAQESVSLQVKDDEGWFGKEFPDGVDELYFAVHGIIKDPERLKQLFDLFGDVLDRLCRIGAADPMSPGVVV